MTRKRPNETMESWSLAVAFLAVDVLVDCGLVKKEDIDQAAEVVAEEILVRLAMGDYPPPAPPYP